MPSAYDPSATPELLATREKREGSVVDVERIADALAETAAIPGLLARTAAPVRFVPTADPDPCGACPETGPDARPPADAAALVCHVGPESGYVYREPVCLPDLSGAVGYELITHPEAAVWVEIPVLYRPAVPAWSGCFCDPTRGQSCEVCDGTLAEQAGLL